MSYTEEIPARALMPLDLIIDSVHERTSVLVAQPTPDHGMFVLEIPWMGEESMANATARYFPPDARVLVLVEDDLG